MKKQFPFILASALLILLIGIELTALLTTNFGRFVYTLDDAYIHLSMAENIAQGTYGINPGEFASAASSILWPFILAPFMYFSFALYVPLVLNVLTAIATIYVLWKILSVVFIFSEHRTTIISSLLVLLIPATGMIGLIFTGMEHSLQVLSVVLILYSIIKELHGQFDERLAIMSIVLASLVRYEDLSVCLFAVTFFFVRRRIRAACTALAIVAVLISLFSLFLYVNEGSFLPSSVFAKIGPIRRSMLPISKLLEVMFSFYGMLYFLTALSLAVFAVIHRKDFTSAAVGSGAVFVTLLHLAYGKIQYFGGPSEVFGYYFRYEMYLWTFLLIAMIVVLRNIIESAFRTSKTLAIVLLITAEIVLCSRNNMMLLSISTASNNIFEQHAQIHDFVARFYRKPVAVNDIGYVSYNNSSYVLDLWGLTSKDVLNVRNANPGKSEWLDSLVTEKNIPLVIIYDVWFTRLPSHWKKTAELTLTKPNITASENVVSFYAVNEDAEIVEKLKAFQSEMPNKTMLRIIQE